MGILDARSDETERTGGCALCVASNGCGFGRCLERALSDYLLWMVAEAQLPLSRRVREATAQLHTEAENTDFVRRCLDGAIHRGSWVRLMAELHPVYEALEEALGRQGELTPYAAFNAPELARTARLANDLAFLGGAPALEGPGSLCAARIRLCADEAPHRVLGHAYARYFGDLMGGRILRRAVQQGLGLGESGLTWLAFEINKPAAYVQALREALDKASFKEAQLSEIELEACLSFKSAVDIFEIAGEGLLDEGQIPRGG